MPIQRIVDKMFWAGHLASSPQSQPLSGRHSPSAATAGVLQIRGLEGIGSCTCWDLPHPLTPAGLTSWSSRSREGAP